MAIPRNTYQGAGETDKIRTWNVAGFFAIVMLGFLFHFVYDWTGQSSLVAPFVPVNESVWEHLKLGLWSVTLFAAVEYPVLGKTVKNFFFARAIGVWIISFTILLVYYTYTALLDRNSLVLDIGSYIVGVLLCQLFCYRMARSEQAGGRETAGVVLLIISFSVFAIFTYYPPHRELFKDSRTGTYGIGAKALEHGK